MYSTILLWTSIVSFTGIVAVLAGHVEKFRQQKLPSEEVHSISEYAGSLLDRAFSTLAHLKQHGIKHFYKASLAVLSLFVPWFVKRIRRTENWLVRLVDSVQGKGVIKNTGTASAYLIDIKRHQEEVRKNQKEI